MDRTALLTLKAVAEAHSVTGAAKRHHCVPSAVTAPLKRLEAEAGRALFLRERRGMVPTEHGRTLLGYAERALALLEEAERALREDAEPFGRLRVGATDTAATISLPPVFARFHAAHPEVALEVVCEVSATLIAEVKTGRLDCAIVNRSVADPDLAAEAVRRERLVLASALGVDDPGASSELTLAAHPGGAQRARIEAWWEQAARPPIRLIERPSLALRLSCAAAGMGITALPASVPGGMAACNTVRAHPIPEPWCWLDTHLVAPARGGASAARRRFREVLREAFDAPRG